MFERMLRELQDMQGRTETSVPLLADGDGYLDRECPAEACLFCFKVHGEDWKSLVRDEAVFCPMCRHTAPSGQWHTRAQVDASREYAMNQITGRLNRAMRADARALNASQRPGGLVSITAEVKGPPDPPLVPVQASEPMRLRATCEACGCRYSFVGSAFFCPACGHNSASRTFDHTIENARRAAAMKDQLRQSMPPDDAEVSARLLREKAVSDIVTSVQRLAERVWESLPETQPAGRNVFQRLDDASVLWRTATGKGFDDILSAADFGRLKRHYQRRHLLAHCEGIVDADYLRKSGDTSCTVGQRVVVDEASVLEFADLAARLGHGLLAFLPTSLPRPEPAVPVVGPGPTAETDIGKQPRTRHGYSADAAAVARCLVEGSETGREMDPQISPDGLRQATGLSDDDIIEAVDELERAGLVRRHAALGMGSLGFLILTPGPGLFEVFDPVFALGDPLADARTVATVMLSEPGGGSAVAELASQLGWQPRRMNPALSALASRDLILDSRIMDREWVTPWVRVKPGLRRFARDEER